MARAKRETQRCGNLLSTPVKLDFLGPLLAQGLPLVGGEGRSHHVSLQGLLLRRSSERLQTAANLHDDFLGHFQCQNVIRSQF